LTEERKKFILRILLREGVLIDGLPGAARENGEIEGV
jgi:hypothetical protein